LLEIAFSRVWGYRYTIVFYDIQDIIADYALEPIMGT